MATQELYQKELAVIHAKHFQEFVKNGTAFVSQLLNDLEGRGLVVDLGCANGYLLKELAKKGFDAFGLDISAELIRIAKKELPKATFVCGSFFDKDFKIPSCVAVTSLSECFSYLGELTPASHRKKLDALFSKAYKALVPGGLFVFDMLEPGYVEKNLPRLRKYETEDFSLISELMPAPKYPNTFVRDITFFIKKGKTYIRHHEAHTMVLYPKSEVIEMLRSKGFKVKTCKGYGDFTFRKAQVAYVATKA